MCTKKAAPWRCPSETVDAAWHMHLTYTRAYWTGRCERTLGQPLNRYRKRFGEAPPKDTWPSVARRFAAHDRRTTYLSVAHMLALFLALSALFWWFNVANSLGGSAGSCCRWCS